MKKLLFIDRDGTLIEEPPIDFQVDSFEKLRFLPGVFTWLGKITRELGYELVMVTNQDGLGTPAFPEENFWPVHNLMLRTFESEGIVFSAVHIDRSFEHEKRPTRKPGTAMLTPYTNGAYDLAGSWVIGDRLTDVELAKNLGAKSILLAPSNTTSAADATVNSWENIYTLLALPSRKTTRQRKTSETDITITLDPDGTGQASISTGLPFFDHMLEQLARHGQMDLSINAQGDLHIDEHHTIEDVAITLGETMAAALGNKQGMERYGFVLPMDDCLAQVAVDFGGRSWLVWEAEFKREKIGSMPTEMFFHFFKSFSDAARCNLNIQASGTNEHHKIESIFKAFAKAIRGAVRREAGNRSLPSTKGMI